MTEVITSPKTFIPPQNKFLVTPLMLFCSMCYMLEMWQDVMSFYHCVVRSVYMLPCFMESIVENTQSCAKTIATNSR